MGSFEEETQRVKDYLRGAILRAELPAGAPVSEQLLRNEMGASVRAVKEALKDLSREGILTRKRHAGTRVSARLPSIICAVLPPVRSLGLISAYDAAGVAASGYFQSVLQGIRKAMMQPSRLVELFNAPGPKGLDDLPRIDVEQTKRNVQGLIALEVTDGRGLNELVRVGLPLVSVDFCASDSLFDAVCVDHIGAGFSTTMHLQELGHSRIAFVGETQSAYSTDPTWQDRLTGYLRGIAVRAGTEPRPLLLDVRRDATTVYQKLPEFHRACKPTAYVLCSGGFNAPALKALREMGLECPRDISLACADNSVSSTGGLNFSRYCVSYSDLGWNAVRLLASRLACRPMPSVRMLQPGTFVHAMTSQQVKK